MNMIKLYQVGGSVRDEILGIKSKDIDYAVEADSFEDMKKYLLDNKYTIFVEKPEYLVIRAKTEKEIVDFALCRSDGFYSDGRRPDKVHRATIMEDLARRDFTINAIAKDTNGEYLDPFNGQEDLRKKIIRSVGDPEERMKEDSLRIVRALRFSITKQFKIDKKLFKVICDPNIYKLLSNVAIERIRDELEKMFKYDTKASLRLIKVLPDGLIDCLFHDNMWLLPTNKKIKNKIKDHKKK